MAPSRPFRERKRPTIGAIYNPRQAQVKNGEIAVFRFIARNFPCLRGVEPIFSRKPIPRLKPPSKTTMRAVLDIVLIVLDLYVWLLIASAILSWLIAFNVVNTRNQFVASVAEFL